MVSQSGNEWVSSPTLSQTEQSGNSILAPSVTLSCFLLTHISGNRLLSIRNDAYFSYRQNVFVLRQKNVVRCQFAIEFSWMKSSSVPIPSFRKTRWCHRCPRSSRSPPTFYGQKFPCALASVSVTAVGATSKSTATSTTTYGWLADWGSARLALIHLLMFVRDTLLGRPIKSS